VQDKIEFINSDFFDQTFQASPIFSALTQADAVFISPPWGGPSYNVQQTFDVEEMQPYSSYFLL